MSEISFADLRCRFQTGRSYIVSGEGRNRVYGYRSGYRRYRIASQPAGKIYERYGLGIVSADTRGSCVFGSYVVSRQNGNAVAEVSRAARHLVIYRGL